MSKIKILLVDDHAVVRAGIREILERDKDFEVIGEASDGEAAVRMAGSLLPDVILMDIGMPKINGLEATERILKTHPDIAILILTIHDDEQYVKRIMLSGASGYLLKGAFVKQLVYAIKAVATGELVFDRAIRHNLLGALAPCQENFEQTNLEPLTHRESEVLRLIADGMSNAEIAKALDVRIGTIKYHLVNIFAKLRVKSRTQAILVGLKYGIVKSAGDSPEG